MMQKQNILKAKVEFKRQIANRTAKKYEEWGLNYRLFEGEMQANQDKKLVLNRMI